MAFRTVLLKTDLGGVGAFQPAPETDEARFNVFCGPSTTFSNLEEREHLTYMASIGYGYARSEFISLANDFAIGLNIKSSLFPVLV